MNTTPKLEIRKSGKGFGIFAGKSRLAKFKTEAEALSFMGAHAAILAYWAESASVSVENATPKEIRC